MNTIKDFYQLVHIIKKYDENININIDRTIKYNDTSGFTSLYGVHIINICVNSKDLINNYERQIATLAHEFGHYQSFIISNKLPKDCSGYHRLVEEFKAWRYGSKFLKTNNIKYDDSAYIFALMSFLSHCNELFMSI